MKAQARTLRTFDVPNRRRPAARAQTKPRSGAGNRHRANALEREAEELARRFARGEKSLGTRVTPATAAALLVPSSSGRPLPPTVRRRFDASFDASFDAVRVHTGSEADAVARQTGAEAFTSGRDIFFRGGRFAPETAAGRELLAHELAHVLQQTGRRNSDQQLAATDVRGTGGIQRVASIHDDFVTDKVFESTPSLDTVIARHLAENPTDTDLPDHARTIKDALNSTSTDPSPVDLLLAKTKEPGFTTKREHLALYFDALKQRGEYDAARKLVKYVLPGRTAFGLSDFYAKKLKGDLTWMEGTIAASALLSKYWKRRFVDTFRIYLFAFGRMVQDLGPDRKFTDVYKEQIDGAGAPAALIDNERRFYALAALKYIDAYRISLLQANYEAMQKSTYHPFAWKLTLADWLVTGKNLEDYGKDLPDEAKFLWNAAIPDIQKVAKEATEFWNRVIAFEKARRERKDFESLGPVVKLLGSLITFKEFKNLERDLLAAAKRIFYLPGGRTPSADVYKANMKAQAASLARLAVNYDLRLLELARQVSSGKNVNQLEYIELGWVQWFLLIIAENLKEYVPAALPAKATAADVRLRQDELVRHRLTLAGWWAGVADQLEMKQLADYLYDVRFGRVAGQRESELAIFGDWELDEESGLELMHREFPKGEVKGAEPLTGADIANFSYLLYVTDLTAEIRKILDKEGWAKDFSGTKGPVINEALSRVKKKGHPQRYLLKDYFAAIVSGDRPRFADLVNAHPKYKEFVDALDPEMIVFIPASYSIHSTAGGIVLWTIPRLQGLVDLFAKALPALDALVRAQMAKNQAAYDAAVAKAKKGREPEPIGPEALQWMRALSTVIKEHPEYGPQVYTTIAEGLKSATAELEKEARRATNHQRRVLLLNAFGPTWAAYDSADIATYEKPGIAMQGMMQFAGSVAPHKDSKLQMAALLIELGPLLYARLGPQEVLGGALETSGTSRYDIIVGLAPHLIGTVALAAIPEKLKEIQSLDLLTPFGFNVHLGAVNKLKAQLEQSTIELQLSREMNVNKGAQSVSTPAWSYVLYPGEDNAFTIEGNEYQLVEVNETFTFIPSVDVSAGGIDWPESELGDSILKYSNDQPVKKEARKGEKQLLKILRNGTEIVVRDNDDRMLAELMHVVEMQGFVSSMETLATVLETYGEIIATGIEFIPGIGTPVMAARIVTSILTFIASPQFKLIQDALGGDAGKLLHAAIDKVEEMFSADALWSWLLFGEPELPHLPVLGQTEKQSKVADKHSKSSAIVRLLRLIGRLLRLAVSLGQRVERLHEKFEYPIRRTEVFIINHPVIALVINFILDNFARLSRLHLSDLSLAPEFTAQLVGKEMSNLSVKITELLKTVEEIALPEEIVSLEQMINVVLDLVIDALPKKYKLVGEAVEEGLRMIGAWDKILTAIANRFKAAEMDPNILWRDLIRSKLQPVFESLAGEVADAATSLIKGVPFLRDTFTGPDKPSLELGTEEGEFPDVQELASEHAPSERPPLMAWPRTAGVPLDEDTQRDAARRFGHDFSHVRLHTGADARALTQSFGAEGLTSGSHVYLRSGLSPQSGHGAEVLRHELSHVIQQTGPRPRTEAHPPQPVPGEPGQGVRHDGALEAAADRSAAQAQRAPVAARPLDPGSTRERAPQPKLEDLMKKFFMKVSEDAPLLERVKDISEGKGGPKIGALKGYAERVVAQLPEKFTATLQALPATKFPKYLQGVYDKVIQYVISNHKTTIEQSMRTLVRRAHEGKPVKKKDTSGTVKQTTEYSLNASRLEQEIEEFVFGLTGVAIDIEFNLEKPAPGGPKNKEIDLAKPFSTFEVQALHLAYVGGTAALWDLIVDETWVKHSPAIAPPSRFKNRSDFKSRAEAIAAYKLHSRLVLRSSGPHPKVFASKEFRFSDWFAKEVEGSIFTVAGGQLDPKAIPSWSDYISEAQTTKNYSSASGHQHLTFGTYADRKKPGIQWGVARNAHHITQYLLLEYFRNKKADQPFPHPLKNYPGVTGSGSKVKEIVNPDDNTSINVGTYEASRGGKMPTILISEHTHEKGGVHVHGKPDEKEESGPSSPGFLVHDHFTTFLGKYADIVAESKPTKLQAIDQQTRGGTVPASGEVRIGGKLVTSADLQKAIYRAANKTYQWMRDDMKTKLREGLKVEEVRYYEFMVRRQMQENGVANYDTAKLPAGFEPSKTDLTAVSKQAEAHNKSIMEDPQQVGFQTTTP